jgi:hypothetical protein
MLIVVLIMLIILVMLILILIITAIHGLIVVDLLAEMGLHEVILAGCVRQNGEVDHEKNGEQTLEDRVPRDAVGKEHDVGRDREGERLERGISNHLTRILQHLVVRTSSPSRQALNFFSGSWCLYFL